MNFTPQQQHSLLSKMGYTGPVDSKMMDAFLSSNPGAAARMGKFSRAAQKMGGVTGMAEGGSVSTVSNTGGTSSGGFTVSKQPGLSTMYDVKDASGAVVASFPNQPQAKADADSRNNAASTTNTPITESRRSNSPTQNQQSEGANLAEVLIQDPTKLTTEADVARVTATPGTLIDGATGQVQDQTQAETATTGETATSTAPNPTAPATIAAVTSAEDVGNAVQGVTGAQGEVSQGAQVTAAQQTESSISGMEAAQGEAFLMNNPVQRELQNGEIISGSAVDAAKVENLMSSVQAATATPSEKATVQGQLEGLMAQFEGGKTPAWAAGAMRNAQAMLAQRGLGASSIAGQAVIQAAMESALPIAQVDAATFAQFESQNLSNRQQTALFAAQQRASFLQMDFDQAFQTRVLNAAKVSDIANMNFTAEQNIALENSRAVNSMNLANLDARQGMLLAQAAALSQLDITNLNNRQQAAVQNAQAFLQMDMANLDNRQQAEMFRAQSNVQALFTDQAAENAAIQFNAASKNQTDQFFADLGARVSMFNSEQRNAMAQFNAGETNATRRFNAQLEAARKQFNANNSLIIAQANAKWRQDITTMNTAARNEANLEAARTSNALTAKALDEIWQRERDTLAFAFTAMQNDSDRALQITLADKEADMTKWAANEAESSARTEALVRLVFGW